ncbi:MAG TPA: hypothetical protein VE326_10405 [Candidatus Binatia bacterium]|nr:hypothetical protein [Candidatus Binatia bacterium]
MSGGAAAAAAAARMRAIQASGAIVRLEAAEFERLLIHNAGGIVVHAPGGFLGGHRYLTSYKGLVFSTKTREPLSLPGSSEIIEAGRIWTPH